jgi:hypothetical protein
MCATDSPNDASHFSRSVHASGGRSLVSFWDPTPNPTPSGLKIALNQVGLKPLAHRLFTLVSPQIYLLNIQLIKLWSLAPDRIFHLFFFFYPRHCNLKTLTICKKIRGALALALSITTLLFEI